MLFMKWKKNMAAMPRDTEVAAKLDVGFRLNAHAE